MADNDDMTDRLKRLEDELAEMKAIVGAADDMRREVENEPYGLDRLRRVKRKTTHPNQKEDD